MLALFTQDSAYEDVLAETKVFVSTLFGSCAFTCNAYRDPEFAEQLAAVPELSIDLRTWGTDRVTGQQCYALFWDVFKGLFVLLAKIVVKGFCTACPE